MAFYEFIRIHNIRLKTVVLGLVASSGMLIFLSGGYRVISSNSSLRLHDISKRCSSKEHQLSDLTEITSQLEAIQERYQKIIADRTNLSVPRIQKMMSENTRLDSREAKELGFAHEVV